SGSGGFAMNAHDRTPTAEEPVRATVPETSEPDRRELHEVVATFSDWLYMPDEAPLLAVLGTVAANMLPGDPVWLVVIRAPSSGKSEMLQSVGVLPMVHAAGTLTEASLLSGTSTKDYATDAKGGLLRKIGDFGLLLLKDFGSVLSMNRDARGAVFAALREI